MKKSIITLIILNCLCMLSHSANWEGSGTENNPYLISTSQQLATLAEEVDNGNDFRNVHFSLTNDIDLSNICDSSQGNWKSIGNAHHYFDGIFLGNNHTISNLYINIEENSGYYSGLFGNVGDHCVIADIILGEGHVYTTFWSGSLVGANNGVISNCTNIGCSVESWQYAGGICGVNFNTIEGCLNQANVKSTFCAGGICAYNYGTITNSTNHYEINSIELCGGICGYNGGFSDITNCNDTKIGFIDNCNNISLVSCNRNVGGITGRNDGLIVNSMNSGRIYGRNNIGGLAGQNGGFDGVVGNISNSFNIGVVISGDSLSGGIVGQGYPTSEIFNVYTYDNTYCEQSDIFSYIGDENGITENCFVIKQNDVITDINDIAEQMNEWVDNQYEQDSYLHWEVKEDYTDSLKKESSLVVYDQRIFQGDPNNKKCKCDDNIRIFSGKGRLYIISANPQTVHICTMDGKLVHTTELSKKVMSQISLDKGIYLINKCHKAIVY